MIVEDEDLIRKGMVYMFDWSRYDCVVVAEAANGQEALDLIEKEAPDILITDIRMPIMDGLGLLEAIKDMPVETVILSGYDEFNYAKKAISYDVSDYLLKPVKDQDLGKALTKICDKIRKNQVTDYLTNKMESLDGYKILDCDIYYSKVDYISRYTPQVLDFIKSHYADKISLDTIAGQLEVSGTYLARKFKEDIHHTFTDFLTRYRLQKALELMNTSDLKIYQIAEEVGFSEYKYFSQVFKNHTGYSPSDFMQQNVIIQSRLKSE